METNKYKLALLFIIAVLVSDLSQAEQSSRKKGYDIALAVDNRNAGFQDSVAKLSMILENSQGRKTVRELEIKVLENIRNGDKSLIKFNFPADIKGTSLLTHPFKNQADGQWLFLPAVNRTKRISSRNKSGAFMGSEFSFEDMTNKNIEDYTYNYISTEACFDYEAKTTAVQCDIIERYPIDKHSGYSKQIMWVDQLDKKIYKIEYYDRKNVLLKVFKAHNFVLYKNRYWRANKVVMHNVQTNKVTSLEYKSIKFTIGLNDRDFHRSALRD
ncbi:outer membrane lipoprotein-sorting protein [Parashewanella tropica]|uniref:outer membrane lipoprotein-sorting protein n=1 Tax=Parashewanella tropica TaxID=2547970 RepID=UPI001059E9B5|nr:outer membrane lipoprotein-sorting protein [Parashewanella tropica]